MAGTFEKIALAGLLVSVSQPAIAQSTSENTARIEQLEARLDAILAQSEAQQAEIAELRAQNLLYRAELDRIGGSGGNAAEQSSPVDPYAPVVAEQSAARIPSAADRSRTDGEAMSAYFDLRRETVNRRVNAAFDTAEPLPFLADGSQGAPARGGGTAVGITASKDGGRVAISLSSSRFRSGYAGGIENCLLSSGMDIGVNDPCNAPNTYQQDVTNVSLSAPASNSGDTSFATLDGLVSGLKTEFRHTIYFGRIPDAGTIDGLPSVDQARARCVEANRAEPQRCTELSSVLADRYMDANQQEVAADAIFDQIIAGSYGITFNGAIGYNEYSFFPDTTFSADTAERVSLSAGAGLIYFPSRGSSLLFESNFQRTYEAATSTTRCRPEADAGNDFLTCATGAFAGPSRVERLILGTQYRRQFDLAEGGLLPRLAIAPRFEFDALSNDYSIDVPVFLVSNTNSGMVAGIRFGFEDESNDSEFKIGVFYGTSFDLTPF